MLNICIVFAQLERETIQKRVTDAYYSRCLKGFHMSGQAPYGYQLEPTVVEGIRTKKMVADPVAADHVRLMFEMYAEPETSFGDITRHFEEQGIKIYEKSMVPPFLAFVASKCQKRRGPASCNVPKSKKRAADYAYMHTIGYSFGSSILLRLQSCDLVSWWGSVFPRSRASMPLVSKNTVYTFCL